MKPVSDEKANERKHQVDQAVDEFLDLNPKKVEAVARAIATHVRAGRIVVSGGTGAGKTTVAKALSGLLHIPFFELDDYIPGGGHDNRAVFLARLEQGMNNLWEDLPGKKPWVIEHIECCSPLFREFFEPEFAILITPGEEHLKAVASARDKVGSDSKGKRTSRSLETNRRAIKQFREAPGTVLAESKAWQIKRLSP